MKIPNLKFERAHELLNYDPDTGNFTWKVSQGKARAGAAVGSVQHGYLKTTIDKEQIKLHRVAWFMHHGKWPEGQIDHIDGNKLNNRISNIRDVTMSVNMQNRYSRKRKESDLPFGVTKNPKGKFVANIRIGIFHTASEASAAFMRVKRLIHEGCTR
jgi:HNH endonuclease